MTVWYLTTLTYPSTLANRLQVIKMTEAFSGHADITLWVANMGGKQKEVLESYGVTSSLMIQELPQLFSWLWPQSFFRALAFRRVVRNAPPEAVFYVRDVLLAFFLTVLSPRFRDMFFFECHSLGKFPGFIYKRVFRRARGIISTNKAKKDFIEHHYSIAQDRITVEPNGFDASMFYQLPNRSDARDALGLPQDKKIVLYAGSTQSWKGVDIVSELARALPDILFVILGAKAEQKTGNLWELLAVDSRVVPKYLRAADVLIAPYRDDNVRAQLYFSPIKIMEYLASGTPIVATDLRAIREIAGDAGVSLVKEYSAEVFGRHIKEIISNSAESLRRAQGGQEYVQRYSWARRVENIARFIGRSS